MEVIQSVLMACTWLNCLTIQPAFRGLWLSRNHCWYMYLRLPVWHKDELGGLCHNLPQTFMFSICDCISQYYLKSNIYRYCLVITDIFAEFTRPPVRINMIYVVCVNFIFSPPFLYIVIVKKRNFLTENMHVTVHINCISFLYKFKFMSKHLSSFLISNIIPLL